VKQASREDVKSKHLADEHTNATAQLQTPSGDDMMHERNHGDSSSVRGDNKTCWNSCDRMLVLKERLDYLSSYVVICCHMVMVL
jgi:hypothetical protein